MVVMSFSFRRCNRVAATYWRSDSDTVILILAEVNKNLVGCCRGLTGYVDLNPYFIGYNLVVRIRTPRAVCPPCFILVSG
jgi:hypothetical protein